MDRRMGASSSRPGTASTGQHYLVYFDLIRFLVTGMESGGAFTVVQSPTLEQLISVLARHQITLVKSPIDADK